MPVLLICGETNVLCLFDIFAFASAIRLTVAVIWMTRLLKSVKTEAQGLKYNFQGVGTVQLSGPQFVSGPPFISLPKFP